MIGDIGDITSYTLDYMFTLTEVIGVWLRSMSRIFNQAMASGFALTELCGFPFYFLNR